MLSTSKPTYSLRYEFKITSCASISLNSIWTHMDCNLDHSNNAGFGCKTQGCQCHISWRPHGDRHISVQQLVSIWFCTLLDGFTFYSTFYSSIKRITISTLVYCQQTEIHYTFKIGVRYTCNIPLLALTCVSEKPGRGLFQL